MDPHCSFVAITPLDFTWHLFAYCVAMIFTLVIHMLDLLCIFLEIICTWTCMSQRSDCLTFLLPFRYLHLILWSWFLQFLWLQHPIVPYLYFISAIVLPSYLIHHGASIIAKFDTSPSVTTLTCLVAWWHFMRLLSLTQRTFNGWKSHILDLYRIILPLSWFIGYLGSCWTTLQTKSPPKNP